jgi:hypothetical protein
MLKRRRQAGTGRFSGASPRQLRIPQLRGRPSSESAPVLLFDPNSPEEFWLTTTIKIKITA